MKHAAEQTHPQEETITVSRTQYEALQPENARLNQKVNWLLEQMRLARQRHFGPSSEKSQYDVQAECNSIEKGCD